MKHTKKLASLLMTLIVVMSLCIPAFATGEGKIEIGQTVPGQTYTIYRLFDLESYSGSNYSYKVNSDWKPFFADTDKGGKYISLDSDGYITGWIGTQDDEKVAEFSKVALKYAEENGISSTGSPITASGTTVTFEGLDLGYYLVDSTMGALCVLTTTKPTATITEKNGGEPLVDKEVKEDGTGSWGKWNDASMDEPVEFRITVQAKKGAQNYVLHDKMSAGLTLDKTSFKVQVDGTDLAAANYTIKTDGFEDDCTFEVIFTEDYLKTITTNKDIVITYKATLNENAVVAGAGNPNESWLDYGDDQKTESSTTKTYTWEFDILKFTKVDGADTPLGGAKFSLYNDETCTEIVNLHEISAGVYQVCTEPGCTAAHTNEIVSPADGKLYIDGLDEGEYYLKEIEAPKGYNKLVSPIKVVITREEDTTGGVTSEVTNAMSGTSHTVGVENSTGTLLPTTGGMGTTLFYIAGSIMLIGGTVLLITKKRMGAEE